ncbi:MAG: hypothetical protein ABSG17_08835 [Spirochaetia bacterium]|jgi:hypothetical protein
MANDDNSSRGLLRHTVATLAYRGGKAISNVPEAVSSFRAGETTRTPAEILRHVCDLIDWAYHLARDARRYVESPPAPWADLVSRLFERLKLLDDFLASSEPLVTPPEKIFQGPIADALTHVGQIAMLRRLAGSPVRGENYFIADIVTGRVGREQAAPRREFD